MIDIYTNKINSKDWILQNDLYFNLNTGNEEMSQKEIDLIWQIDEAKLTPDKHIETKYGLGTIRNLSSGCKTLINIVKHPDKVVNVEECVKDHFYYGKYKDLYAETDTFGYPGQCKNPI